MVKILPQSVLLAPDEETIKSIQDEFEIVFPEDYINFIKENNGAIPVTNKFLYHNHEYLIERFLCLLNEEQANHFAEGCYDIGVVTLELEGRLVFDEEDTGVPIIPIAALFAGDFVCFNFKNGLKKPEVCIWYHEESEEFFPEIKKIANTFTEFLNMIF
ncbi:MAG: SMI1/KNR4 family protein [Oscillospiraceae bacterium]|nr:SMI1/KNR4 family protein [Oscillospiraceae bacterium]